MFKRDNRRDSFQCDHQLKAIGKFKSSVRLHSWQNDSTIDIVTTVLIESGEHVNIAELREHDSLSEEVGIGLLWARVKFVLVYVLDASDVIDLSQLLGPQIQGGEDFVEMLHVLENKSFSLVENEVLDIC